MSDLELAIAGINDQRDEHFKAASYYEGTQAEVFASARLRRALANTGTAFRINYARTPVNAVLDRLEMRAAHATAIGRMASLDDTEEANRAQEVLATLDARLADVMEYNELDLEADEIHRWALVYGECYVMVWPSEEDDEEVDIVFNSPLNTRIFYDPENPRRKTFAAKMWLLEGDRDKRTRVNLYYPDRVEKYVSKGKPAKKDQDFLPYYDTFVENEDDPTAEPEAVWPLPNDYGQVPVFHFRTQRPYGRPEHRDAYGPQDMINKLVITQMASNDYHGFPQRYVLAGLTASNEAADFEEAPGDKKGRKDNDQLTAGPGEVWWLTGEGLKVGQFDAADAKAFLEPLKEYVRGMSSTTSTPLHYFEGMGGTPSGESLRAAEAPLIKKVKDRQQSFGKTWREVFKFVFTLLGVEDVSVEVSWATPQSMDDKDSWDVAKAKQDAGVPKRQTLLEAGYSEDQVDGWDDEPAESDESDDAATGAAA